MKIAVMQTTPGRSVSENLDNVETLVARVAQQHDNVDLIAFPEYIDKLDALDGSDSSGVEGLDGAVATRLGELAKRNRIWLLAGSIREQSTDDERYFNTSVLFNRDGEIAATYRKIHLFDACSAGDFSAKESDRVLAGDQVVTADVDGVRVGLSICYDLRFPELYRQQVEQGARVLFVPSAFTAFTGRDHWEVLLRARAIENQCFVVAPGQYGKSPGGRSWHGRSLIIDPWGTVLGCVGDGEGYSVVELDFDRQDRVRESIPALSNRQLM